jgi:hypothetical protein
MEIKVLLCNCKGLCDSFQESDMNALPFAIESDLDVKYSVLPQLCGQGGNAVLADVFKSTDPDTYVLVGRRRASSAAAQSVANRIFGSRAGSSPAPGH